MLNTEFWVTCGFLLAGAGLAGWMAWLEKNPRKSLTPRLVPTTFIMLIGALVFLIALFHLSDEIRALFVHRV
jgi:hypothetical protein